jgi:hypothetical protein
MAMIEIDLNKLTKLYEAIEELEAGVIRINRQDSRVTNWSLNLIRAALREMKGE